jgi:hypothetical protein
MNTSISYFSSVKQVTTFSKALIEHNNSIIKSETRQYYCFMRNIIQSRCHKGNYISMAWNKTRKRYFSRLWIIFWATWIFNTHAHIKSLPWQEKEIYKTLQTNRIEENKPRDK